MRNLFRCVSSFLLLVVAIFAQQPAPPLPPPPHGPPGEHLLHPGPPGAWWNDPAVIQHLGITPDQQKRMEALFQQNRFKLMTLSAAVDTQEEPLQLLLEADHPDEARVLAQIDRIAQARADLERANARFLLGLRTILTPEQWRKLESAYRPPRPPSPDHPSPP